MVLVNATPDKIVAGLLASGASSTTLGIVAGVNRSSALRWTRGARPRGPARERLRTALDLLERQPPGAGVSFGQWLASNNPALGGLTPAVWIREGREWSMLADSWAAASGAPSPPEERVGMPDAVAAPLSDIQSVIAGLDLAPLRMTADVSGLVSALSLPSSLIADFSRNLQMLAVSSAASQIGQQMALVSQSLHGLTAEYVRVAGILPLAEQTRAFRGMEAVLAGLGDVRPNYSYSKVLSSLMGDVRPAIGSLALGIDLQLSTSLASALASLPALQRPYLLERTSWRRWLPQHPNALTRSGTVETGWLLGETHNAAHASVAALGSHAEGVDIDEVAAALSGVAFQFPDLLAMEVPGTGMDMRSLVRTIEPRLDDSLQGAIDRLRDGGSDSARQAAASLRAALDQLADHLAPGSPKGRVERYVAILEVEQGNPDGTLLYHQICILYSSYASLSNAVHNELDIGGVRAVAYGMFSAIAGVLSMWAGLGH